MHKVVKPITTLAHLPDLALLRGTQPPQHATKGHIIWLYHIRRHDYSLALPATEDSERRCRDGLRRLRILYHWVPKKHLDMFICHSRNMLLPNA